MREMLRVGERGGLLIVRSRPGRSCGYVDGRGTTSVVRPKRKADPDSVPSPQGARPHINSYLDGWGCTPPAHTSNSPDYEIVRGKEGERRSGVIASLAPVREGGEGRHRFARAGVGYEEIR